MRWTILVVGAVLVAASPCTLCAQSDNTPTLLPACVEGDPDLRLPDLVPDAPADVQVLYRGSHRVLAFTTAVGNIGDGPLVIAGHTISTPDGPVTQGYQIIWRRDGSHCARQTGRFVYHPSHRHFHFDAFVGYELRADDPITGPLAGGGSKESFCLLDLANIRGFPFQSFPRQVTNMTCASQEGIQGISVGWKDVYERFLPGQSIDLDASPAAQVPPGDYFLVNVVDPNHLLWEKSVANNRSFVSVGVGLPAPSLATSVPAPTARPVRPHLLPGRVRPARPPRPTRPPRVAVAQPTATPTPVAPPAASATPQAPQASDCDHACSYTVSQMRMLWYGALNFSAVVRPGACEPLSPDPGTTGTVQMTNFVTGQRQDTGHQHIASFVLGDNGAGTTSLNGGVQFSRIAGSYLFTYSAPVPSFANIRDGQNFPVAFNMCLTLGSQAVKMHLVCQGKSQGMLCHAG
jgi:hypothetical protein